MKKRNLVGIYLGCFVCATNDGIRVFNVEPFAQKCYLDLGRVTYAEMLYRTNLIAYVPAEHENGLASNVGKCEGRSKKYFDGKNLFSECL